MDYNRINNIAKWVARVVWVAFVVVAVALCVAVSQKNKTIRKLKNECKAQTEYAYMANARCDSLAKLDCVTITNTIVINQKGVVNTTQANQISRTITTYTRDEILKAIDSLNKAKHTRIYGIIQPQTAEGH